ncbi:hypothetical protein AVEN_69746-1 [Araneus ventricosus]|uniref:Uncharacterized protein n=1 Tax=Araneus ventricosus TaxID=182803 RepID=A0A4Y2CXE6_ARAVE|nr:hypothetical protein AVEN_69746-1 [Araneus ventricosus]
MDFLEFSMSGCLLGEINRNEEEQGRGKTFWRKLPSHSILRRGLNVRTFRKYPSPPQMREVGSIYKDWGGGHSLSRLEELSEWNYPRRVGLPASKQRILIVFLAEDLFSFVGSSASSAG